MTPRFVDTNVLLYRFADEHGPDAAKRTVASQIIDGDFSISVQVLQEFYWQATHPRGGTRLDETDASAVVRNLAEQPVQELTPELVVAAIATSQRFRISYWDAAIIEAARELGCSTVLSEDLNHGQDYGGVRVENPFRGL